MKKVLFTIALLAICASALFFATNTSNVALAAETPSDLRGVKVGDDLSGATVYVDYSKLSFSYCMHAVKTNKYVITQNNFSARYFGYGYSTSMSGSTNIKDWAYPSYETDPQTHAQTQVWKATSEFGGETLTGIAAYTLPEDFGIVTALNVSTNMGSSSMGSSVTTSSIVFVSAADFSKFKGLTYDDGISAYSGLSLDNTMFAVRKPVFTKSFSEMLSSSTLENRATLFSGTYMSLLRTSTEDIILRYSTDKGMTYKEQYLWKSTENTDSDIVYFEFDGTGGIYPGGFIDETTAWLRIVTLETYTVKFVDQYGDDSLTVTKRRGEELSIPYITQPSTPPLVTYSWICDKDVSSTRVEQDRTYTKTMSINNDKVLTSYTGKMQTVNDGFPSMLKFYLVQHDGKYAVYVGIDEFQNIVDSKVLEADKTTSNFVLKLHSLNSSEQSTNYLTARMSYADVVNSTVGAKSDLYWYRFDAFDEETGSFDPSTFAQVQLTVTMTFDEIIFNDYVDVPVQIYGYVSELKNLTIRVRCIEYFNGEIDLKLPVNFWNEYSIELDDVLIHKFVFEEDKNTNWTTSDGYYVAKAIDTIYIKQDTSDFVFTNNINDKTMSFPVKIDGDGNYYVTIMLDNPLQVNSTEFLANNGWRDKFDGMSTLADLKYCTDEAKTFIRSMLSCDNYTNYDFGQSGYYITGLPGHTVYSNTAGEISTIVGIKVYITTPMLTNYNKTYRLALVSEEEYTQEESKIPSSWIDDVWNGVSGTGSSVLDGVKSVLWVVLSIAMTVALGKIIAKLIGKSKNNKKNGR